MKWRFVWFWYLWFTIALWLRYRVIIKGFDKLNPQTLNRPGGTLFLANHPALIDPPLLLKAFYKRFRVHPIAADFLEQSPAVRYIMELFGSIFIPGFEQSSNSFKRKKIEKIYSRITDLLRQGENILIYPAGALKGQPEEIIGGNSGVHDLLKQVPYSNIVLVRTTGLWGSTFSKAITGTSPKLIPTFLNGFKIVLKNLIFFTPRREVTIECEPAPADFPWDADRRVFNRYLEDWYNKNGPEPLKLVSFSFLGVYLPLVYQRPKESSINLNIISDDIKKLVIYEIAQVAHLPEEQITAEKDLAYDLGLDSLDRSQLVLVLKEQFSVPYVNSAELTTVGMMMAFAAHLKKSDEPEEEETKISKWHEINKRPAVEYPKQAQTLIEAFLITSERMKGQLAAADASVGEISYDRLKIGVVLFARYIQNLPGRTVGIMLPASAAASMLIFATILAGKIPVMINWTLGERNLEAILEITKLQVVLSSWKFLNRLENTELGEIGEHILLIETIREEFTLREKLAAKRLAKKSTTTILKRFKANAIKPDNTAVILFTSGTESLPKGVPLTHHNIMENHRGALSLFLVQPSDVILGFLPPFHSFGFSVIGTLPLLTGWRVAFYPNPTNGKQIVNNIYRWKATIICCAPTFLRNILRAGSVDKLDSLCYIISGAEKATKDLFEAVHHMNSKIEMIEGYGITECAPILTLNRIHTKPCGVGQPLPQVEIKIVSPEALIPVPQGEEGLILAHGPNIFLGYLGHVVDSPFVEIEGKRWYKTGDLGFLEKNGNLVLSGRLKRFLKVGGEMISLGAVESALLEGLKEQGISIDSEVSSLAVVSVESEGKKGELHLFTTFDADKSELNDILRKSGMSNLIRLQQVHKVHVIPTLGTGKIDYQRLTNSLSEKK